MWVFCLFFFFRIDMLNEATRDFLTPFLALYGSGPPEKTINNEIRKFTLPRYMPAFEKVQEIFHINENILA